MKKQYSLFILIVGILLSAFCYGQGGEEVPVRVKDSIVVGSEGPDKSYREDQFYVGFTFNLLHKKPVKVHQSGFSGGFHTGFIRDIPLNTNRTFALGVGAGWSFNTYRSNLMIGRNEANQSIFQILDGDDYDYQTNWFMTNLVEVPFQFRWRTSTAESHKFWRIYTGLQLGYIFHFQSNFKQNGNKIVQTSVDGLNRLRYGATFTFGYNTFNFTVYYSLNDFFDAKTTDENKVSLSTFQVGLMFYIL